MSPTHIHRRRDPCSRNHIASASRDVSEPTQKKKPRGRRLKPRVIDAYRADVSRVLSRVLGAAALLVLLGSFAAGSALVQARLDGGLVVVGRRPSMIGVIDEARSVSTTAWSLGLLGLVLVMSGAGTAIIGLRHVLREERYLLLRKDGAVFVRGKARRVVKWRDVEDVVSEDGQLVLRCHDGTELTVDERWSGVSVPELAKRAAQLRRRALMGLLR